MSVLEQNHNAYDEFPVLETVVRGNKDLFKIKSEIDALYADYTDENAEKIGELQVLLKKWMVGMQIVMLRHYYLILGIDESLHYQPYGRY